MPDILFIILISIFTLCISFISTKGTLSNLQYKRKWWKIITTRGKVVIFLTLTIIGLLIWQNEATDRKNDKKDQIIRNERNARDSLISVGIDSNRKILFKDLSEALSKQNLRLDTVTKRLKNLNDSANRTVVINNNKKPTLRLCPDGIYLDNSAYPKLMVKYCGFEDWVKIIDVDTYVIIIDTLNTFHFLSKSKKTPQNMVLTPSVQITDEYDLRNINLEFVKGFYVYIKGTYSDKYLKNKYQVYESFYFGLSSKRFSFLVGQLKLNMLAFLKESGQL